MHHRALAAVVVTASFGAAAVAVDPARPPAAPKPVAVPSVRHAPSPVRPGALRDLAAIMAGQAVTLRAAVHQCAPHRARGACVLLALGHAEAAAKLNGLVLRATAQRLPAGPCVALVRRLGSVAATVAAVAGEGVHSRTWPGATWAAARAAARVGARVLAVRDGRWPRTCLALDGGLRA
jgi:hypothetical protein